MNIRKHYESTDAKSLKIELVSDLDQLNRNSIKEMVNQKECFVVYPHEWETRSEQILSHIRSYNSSDLSILNARDCKIGEIPLYLFREFCDQYHIQGSNKLGLKAWGIFYENSDEILGAISLGRHHRQHDAILLDRLCFKNDIRIRGGAGKLFSVAKRWAMEQGHSEIVSFSDNRWSIGTVYEKLGFILDKELPVDYFYVSEDNFCKKFSKQSQKKSQSNCPDDMTEMQWARNRGLLPVYDAGKKRWIYKLKLKRKIRNTLSNRRHGYYETKKAGTIYYQSSYELRAATLLDEMKEVKKYSNQVRFVNNGKNRYIDFLVTWADNTHSIIEVKPERRIDKCQNQIDCHKAYAKKQGWKFNIWTEKELGFKSEYFLKVWADKKISEIIPVDFTEERKKKSCKRVKKYYQNRIAKDKVEVYCDFCNETHNPLRLTYEKNIKRNNGKYICERHGGHIAGKKPKKKKENPYATEGKKQCTECTKIKPFDEFGKDKSRRDGYSNKCKLCRSQAALKKYHQKKEEK